MATATLNDTLAVEPRTSRAPLIAYPLVTLAAFFLSWHAGTEGRIGMPLAITAVLLLVIPLFVLVHELGHVLAGWLAGFRLVWARAMLLQVWRSPAGFRWGGTLQGLNGGEVGMVPADLARLRLPDDLPSLRRRFVVLFAGGPLATLVLLAAVATLAGSMDFEGIAAARSPATAIYLRMVTSAMLGASAFSVLLGLLPLVWPGETHTDERKLRELLGGGEKADREVYRLLANAYLLAGDRPRDWMPRRLREFYLDPVGPPADPLDDAAILYLAYYCALDEGDLEEAAALLERHATLLRELPPTSQRKEALLSAEIEGIFLAALAGTDADAARARLRAVRERSEEFAPDPDREQALLRAEAAVLRAQGAPEQAAVRAGEALAALARVRHEVPVAGLEGWTARRILRGTAVAEREWLERIRLAARLPASEPFPQPS